MFSTDRNIAWKRKEFFVPTSQFQMGDIGGLTMSQLIGPSYGFKEISSGSPTTIQGVARVPNDVNPEWEMGVTALVGFKEATTALDAKTFGVTCLLDFIANTVIQIATAATALNTIIPAATAPTLATTGKQQWVGRGLKNAGFLTRAQVMAGALMQFSLVYLATGAAQPTLGANDNIFLLGLNFDYVPMRTRHPHSEVNAPLDDASP